MSHHPVMRGTIVVAILLSFSGFVCAGTPEAKVAHLPGALDWRPPRVEGATLHEPAEFLPHRQWERLWVWTPKDAGSQALPCIVMLYGGGYGEKGLRMADAAHFLKRGYVLAGIDYQLGSDAPVPLASWDVAAGLRHLRADAARYGIDPERIGVLGWSAGGWIAQDLCFAGPERQVVGKMVTGWDGHGRPVETTDPLPMMEPRILAHGDVSCRVQAVVSDWGCGKLFDRRKLAAEFFLTSDDPPLMTVFDGPVPGGNAIVDAVTAARAAGIPAAGVYEAIDPRTGRPANTHVPANNTRVTREDGGMSTWGDAFSAFFDEQLKNPKTATAPELRPHGGPIAGPTQVRLLTVHPAGSIHYTLDGSDPTPESPRAQGSVMVRPGQTLKAIGVREGLKPSRIATATFVEGPPAPRIGGIEPLYEARVGEPFRLRPTVVNGEGTTWAVYGVLGPAYNAYPGDDLYPPHTGKGPPRRIPWLRIDRRTGELTGTPTVAGYHTQAVIFCCRGGRDQRGSARNGPQEPNYAADAVRVTIIVRDKWTP